jgi:hypothetical protein
MPGGLLQLVAYGAQNLYLNGNPTLSFFKKVYKTHTNFASESLRINFNKNEINFKEQTHLTTKIDRNADLLNNIYFIFTIPTIRKKATNRFGFVENLGEAIIQEYYIHIGGNVVDKQYGEWLHIWSELALESSKRYGYEKMIGNVPEIYRPDDYHHIEDGQIQVQSRKIIVPLLFWFNQLPGLALPLIALQYHEVELHIILRPLQELVIENGAQLTDCTRYFTSDKFNIDPYLECNYIYLDTDERLFFAKHSLDYLIQQVVRIPFYDLNNYNILDLVLQNPVKEIIWVIGRNDRNKRNAWFDYGDAYYAVDGAYKEVEILNTAKLTFNGLDRIEEKDASYFNLIQPYQHHTVIPKPGIYLYSFSLNPEKFQPSGSCNMSRLHKIQLHLSVVPPSSSDYKYDASVYVTNYNFLRVTAGLAGVAFSC